MNRRALAWVKQSTSGFTIYYGMAKYVVSYDNSAISGHDQVLDMWGSNTDITRVLVKTAGGIGGILVIFHVRPPPLSPAPRDASERVCLRAGRWPGRR